MSIKGFHNTPSAAHMAKLIGHSPEATAKNILELRQKKFFINLSKPRDYLMKLFGGADYDWLMTQAGRISNERLRLGNFDAWQAIP